MAYEDNMMGTVGQGMEAGLAGMQSTAEGAQYGLQGMVAGAQIGGSRMVADIGRLMPAMPSIQFHPYMNVRHGMYAHEMSLMGDVQAMFGQGTPQTTTLAEHQHMAGEDMGRRIASAAGAAGVYGSSAAVSWFGGGALMGKAAKMGYEAAKVSKAGVAAASAFGSVGAGAVGVMGGAAAAAPALAAVLAVDAVAGKVMDDVQDRQQIMNFVEASSWRYAQGTGEDIDKKQGTGFNRKARAKIAEGVKKVDLEDPYYNMADLKGVLEQGTELGLFSQVKDADDFSQKFKDLTSTLKSVAKTLHTTLSEGLQTIKEMKDMGIRGPEAVETAMRGASILGTATGKTALEVLSIGRQGAEMVRGTGINLSTGAGMLQTTNAMMSQMEQSGALSSEQIAQAGGVGNLAQTTMQRALQNLNSDYGRGTMMALAGGQSGILDLGKLDQLTSGNMSMGQIFGGASSNISSAGGYVNAVINRDANMRQITEQYGDMGGQMMSMGMELSMAKQATMWTGKSVKDTAKFLALQKGETEVEFESRWKMAENAPEWAKEQQAAQEAEKRKVRLEAVRETTSVSSRLGDAVDKMIEPVSTAVGRTIDNVAQSITDAYTAASDKIGDIVTGAKRTETTEVSNADILKMIAGGEMSNVKKTPEQEKLEEKKRTTYTEDARKEFEKTKSFEKMEETYGNKVVSSEAVVAASTKGLDAFSAQVFDGRGYDKLTRDEKMYLETKSKELGFQKVTEEMGQKKLETQKEVRDQEAIIMSKNDEDTEKAKAKLDETHENITSGMTSKIREQAVKSGKQPMEVLGMMGDAQKAGDAMERIYEDPKKGKMLDQLITSTANIRDIEEKIKTAEQSGNKDEVASLKKQLTKESEQNKQARTEVIKADKDSGLILKAFDATPTSDLKEMAKKVENTRGAYDVLANEDKRNQVQESIKTNLYHLTSAADASMSSDDMTEMQGMLGKIAEGKTVDSDKFRKLASASKVTGLAQIASQQRDIDVTAARGGLKDTESLGKFLVDRKLIDESTLKSPEGKEHLKSFFDNTGKIQKEKLLQFEILATKADKQAGTVVSGGNISEKSMQQEASAMRSIVEVQERTQQVANQLEMLYSKLEPRVGTGTK